MNNPTYESVFAGVVAKLDALLERDIRENRLTLEEQMAVAQAIGIIDSVNNEYQYHKELGL